MSSIATKTDRVLSAFRAGEEMSASQIRSRFGFSSTNAVRGVVARLRTEGFCIYSNSHQNTKGQVTNKYRLGTPPRSVVAAGLAALAEQGINPLV
jgi:hypothetical protein